MRRASRSVLGGDGDRNDAMIGSTMKTPRRQDDGGGHELSASIARYLRHLDVERRVAANTLASYRRDLARLDRFASSHGLDVVSLTRQDLEAFVREAMASGLAPASTARLV